MLRKFMTCNELTHWTQLPPTTMWPIAKPIRAALTVSSLVLPTTKPASRSAEACPTPAAASTETAAPATAAAVVDSTFAP